MDSIEVRDVIGDEVVLADVDMMLNCLAPYST